jgi:hypothetical protein
MITKTQVAEIRDFFDNYETNMSQVWSEMSFVERRNDLSDNMTASKSAENLKSDQHRLQSNGDGIPKMFYGQHFPKNQSILSSSTPNLSSPIDGSSRLMPLLRPLHKYFYLPEEKIHSNELVKIRQHFEVGDGKIAQTKNQITFSEIKGGNISSSLNECAQSFSSTNESFDAQNLPLPLQPSRIAALQLFKNNNQIVFSGANIGGNEMDFTQEKTNKKCKHQCLRGCQ